MGTGASKDTEITFPVRYYNRRCVLFNDPVPARGYKGRVEKPLTVRAGETVVGVMHAGNDGYPGGIEWSADSPDAAMSGSIECIPRMKKIIDTRIAPLFDAARSIGIRVVYLMSGCEDWAREYPQYRDLAARVKETKSPKADFPRCPRNFRRELMAEVLGAEYLERSAQRSNAISRIAPTIEPHPEDWIITTSAQYATLLHENGILNVLLTGFDLSGCLMTEPGGVYDATGLGYRTVVLRDCTTAGESAETAPNLVITQSMLTILEMFRAYTAESGDVIGGIEKALQ